MVLFLVVLSVLFAGALYYGVRAINKLIAKVRAVLDAPIIDDDMPG
jgi:hypothetical protein